MGSFKKLHPGLPPQTGVCQAVVCTFASSVDSVSKTFSHTFMLVFLRLMSVELNGCGHIMENNKSVIFLIYEDKDSFVPNSL